jgi:hypothetical protein
MNLAVIVKIDRFRHSVIGSSSRNTRRPRLILNVLSDTVVCINATKPEDDESLT